MRLLVAAALVLPLAGCGGNGATTATQARKPRAELKVQLVGQSHHPRVGRPWHYQVRVTNPAGRPVAAEIHLQFLFSGVPVGQVGRHRVRNGVWGETFGVAGNPAFPARARGQELVLQAIARSGGRRGSATYWIKVR